jgi:hypothetical protein
MTKYSLLSNYGSCKEKIKKRGNEEKKKASAAEETANAL